MPKRTAVTRRTRADVRRRVGKKTTKRGGVFTCDSIQSDQFGVWCCPKVGGCNIIAGPGVPKDAPGPGQARSVKTCVAHCSAVHGAKTAAYYECIGNCIPVTLSAPAGSAGTNITFTASRRAEPDEYERQVAAELAYFGLTSKPPDTPVCNCPPGLSCVQNCGPFGHLCKWMCGDGSHGWSWKSLRR